MLPLTGHILGWQSRGQIPALQQVSLGNTQGDPETCLPGAKPGTTISLPPAWSSATVGSPFPAPFLQHTARPSPGHPPRPRPTPDGPWPPGPLTMIFLSTGLFFSQFRCLLGVGRGLGKEGGAGCGVGERFHTPHPVYAHSGTTAARGLRPLLPSPNLPGPPSLRNHLDWGSNAALLCDHC